MQKKYSAEKYKAEYSGVGALQENRKKTPRNNE